MHRRQFTLNYYQQCWALVLPTITLAHFQLANCVAKDHVSNQQTGNILSMFSMCDAQHSPSTHPGHWHESYSYIVVCEYQFCIVLQIYNKSINNNSFPSPFVYGQVDASHTLTATSFNSITNKTDKRLALTDSVKIIRYYYY